MGGAFLREVEVGGEKAEGRKERREGAGDEGRDNGNGRGGWGTCSSRTKAMRTTCLA